MKNINLTHPKCSGKSILYRNYNCDKCHSIIYLNEDEALAGFTLYIDNYTFVLWCVTNDFDLMDKNSSIINFPPSTWNFTLNDFNEQIVMAFNQIKKGLMLL